MFSQAFAHHQTNKQHHVVVVAAGPSASVAPPRERRHNSQEHPTLQPKGSVGRASNLPAVSMNTHISLISTLTPIIIFLKIGWISFRQCCDNMSEEAVMLGGIRTSV